jgi:hypothetical protein
LTVLESETIVNSVESHLIFPNQFKVNGLVRYTWCASDAVFLPGLLGKTAKQAQQAIHAPISLA